MPLLLNDSPADPPSGDLGPSRSNRWFFVGTLVLFTLSGASSLVNQVGFSKYLSYVVGSTAHAISAVLAAFMTGLALGAHWGGKWSARIQRPLVAYGGLEIAVALTVAATPLAFSSLTELYVMSVQWLPESLTLLSLSRWAIAFAVVVLPTTAMGATLPFLSRLVSEPSGRSGSDSTRRRVRLGALYAANTLGGALGALGSVYWLLPQWGVSTTLRGSALVAAGIGVVAIVLGRLPGSRSGPLSAPSPGDSSSAREPKSSGSSVQLGNRLALLWILAFGSGALGFAAEVVFAHLLTLTVGTSAYAFGLILAVFLVCLFFGASLAPWVERRLGQLALSVGLSATALTLALTIPLWDRLPSLFAGLGETVTTFAGREAIRALATFAILAIPTTLMGLTFPLLLQRVAPSNQVSHWVGRLTAINTIGAVVGSLVAGYWLLPLLGSRGSLVTMCWAFALAALIAVPGPSVRRSARGIAAFLALTAGPVSLLMPAWDLGRLTSGVNVYFEPYKPPEQILMVHEDVHGGVTTVVQNGSVQTLYTNGKFQGNNGWEMNAQRAFAHYPSLFVDRFDQALVIGLGTGTTLGTYTAYPWRRIDVVEISPAIVSAAETYFREPNRAALDDPRVHLTVADGRNYLLTSNQRYDLIGMELTSVWFAGAASLYSREYYQLIRRRLTDRGIFQQWVQLHHISRRDFATILNTLRSEFESVALFYGGGQGILVASVTPLEVSREHLAQLAQRPPVKATLPPGRSLSSLLDDIFLVGPGFDRFIEESAKAHGLTAADLVSTDDNLYLEYQTPRGNVLPWSSRDRLIAEILRHRKPEQIQSLIQ